MGERATFMHNDSTGANSGWNGEPKWMASHATGPKGSWVGVCINICGCSAYQLQWFVELLRKLSTFGSAPYFLIGPESRPFRGIKSALEALPAGNQLAQCPLCLVWSLFNGQTVNWLQKRMNDGRPTMAIECRANLGPLRTAGTHEEVHVNLCN